MTPSAQPSAAIRESIASLFHAAHECWQGQLLPSLRKAGIEVADYSQLTPTQRSALNKYFL